VGKKDMIGSWDLKNPVGNRLKEKTEAKSAMKPGEKSALYPDDMNGGRAGERE